MSQQIAFEVTVPAPYEKAIEKTAEALKTEGFGILTRIDVKQTLKEKRKQKNDRTTPLGINEK